MIWEGLSGKTYTKRLLLKEVTDPRRRIPSDKAIYQHLSADEGYVVRFGDLVLRVVAELFVPVLDHNLGDLWPRLGLPHRIRSWSLTSLQNRLMKTGGRLVKHARYYRLRAAFPRRC